MENKTISQSDNNYYANLNRLVRFFSRTKSGFAFASIQNQRYIQTINSQLKQLLADHNIVLKVFNFDLQSDKSFIEQLRLVKEVEFDAIVVNNTGLLAETDDKSFTEKGSNNLQQLNFAREQLLELNIPILFWANKNLIGIISNQAADLYSQRNINTIYFDDISFENTLMPELEERFLPEFRDTSDFESLELKIKLLKKQLSDAEQNNYPKQDIANKIALPLALTYSEIDLHSQARELLKSYEAYFDLNNLETLFNLAGIAKNAHYYQDAITFYKKLLLSDKVYGFVKSYILAQLGDIYKETGDIDNALLFYNSDLELSEELYKSNPDEDNFKNNLAISYSSLGSIYQAMGDMEKALHYFNLSSQLSAELYASNPKNESLKNGLAISYSRLGDINMLMGNLEQALYFFNLEASLSVELSNSNPLDESFKSGLALSYSKLGDIYMTLGNYDKALHYFNSDADLSKRLYDTNPKSEYLKNGLAIAYSRLGDIYHSLKDIDKALYYFKLSTELSIELSDSNSKNEGYQNNLALSYSKLGNIFQSKGDKNNSLYYFILSADLFKKLSKSNINNERLKCNLAISYSRLGNLYLLQNNTDKAHIYFNKSLRLFTELYNHNSKSTVNQSNYAEIIAVAAILNNTDKNLTAQKIKESIKIWQDLLKQTTLKYYAKKIETVELYIAGKIDSISTVVQLTKE